MSCTVLLGIVVVCTGVVVSSARAEPLTSIVVACCATVSFTGTVWMAPAETLTLGILRMAKPAFVPVAVSAARGRWGELKGRPRARPGGHERPGRAAGVRTRT